jgi:hypothetical protein
MDTATLQARIDPAAGLLPGSAWTRPHPTAWSAP